MVYSTKQVGSKYSTTFKTYIVRDDRVVSPFHDIPLYSGELVNCVNEIPRFERAKFEISKGEAFNPVVQDMKNGRVRFVKNIYPFFGYQFNYGALPQTWEDPSAQDRSCKANGDNDPIDILDIGTRRKGVGEVYQAKVLGALGLLDDNEADWKIFVIDVEDGMSGEINDIDDVKRMHPDILTNAHNWFRDYKVPDSKPKNSFALNGKVMNAEFAKNIIKEGHASWKKLIKNGYKDISLHNSSLNNEKGYTEDFKIQGKPEADSILPEGLDSFSYVLE